MTKITLYATVATLDSLSQSIARERRKNVLRATLSAKEAAIALGISKATIIRLYHAGQLKGYRTTTARNSHIRIDPVSLRTYKKAREQQPGETKSP